MLTGVNAWGVDSPVLSNSELVLLAVNEIVAGDTEVLFGSDLITTKYSKYVVKWIDVIGTFPIGFRARVSIGGIFIETGTTYWTRTFEAAVDSLNTSYWNIRGILGSDVRYPNVGDLELFTGKSSDINASMRFNSVSASGFTNYRGMGSLDDVGEVDGIKFTSGSGLGALTSGTFYLYGVPNL